MPGDNNFFVKPTIEEFTQSENTFAGLNPATQESVTNQLRAALERSTTAEEYEQNLLKIAEQLKSEDAEDSQKASGILAGNIVSMVSTFKEKQVQE